MIMRSEEFGWLPIRQDYAGSSWRIETAPTFDEAIKIVVTSDHIDEDWFWPPLASEAPPRPVSAFSLPTTHVIKVEPEDDDSERLIEFIVTVLGFLHGILLTPGGWVNLYRVCIKPARWHDFYIRSSACARILNIAEKTWRKADVEAREALFGTIRWHTFALSYDHPFERFLMQYIVLDSAWNAHCLLRPTPHKAKNHSARLEELCRYYHLTLPSWWSVPGRPPAVVDLRNELVHEARWGGKPLGFGHPEEPLEGAHLDLAYFNARLLMALLGEDNAYIHSTPESAGRQLIK
jgi:hypothetical protein